MHQSSTPWHEKLDAGGAGINRSDMNSLQTTLRLKDQTSCVAVDMRRAHGISVCAIKEIDQLTHR